MALGTVQLGSVTVSRFILGGNPFSGFSHQTVARDEEMRRYYTSTRVKATWHQAETLGVNTAICRADNHIRRLLEEYWDEGGALQWVAQTASELSSPLAGVNLAISGGAKAVYLHGGQMEFLLANKQEDEVRRAFDRIKEAGLPGGVAGHVPWIFDWAEAHLACDFYMCSYYQPTPRDKVADHVAGMDEIFDDADRDRMVARIATLSKPVIHYKVLAAGRKTPQEGFAFVARHLRPQDAVCVGVFTKDKGDMLEEDLALFAESQAATV